LPSPCRYDQCGRDGVVRVASCNTQTKKWVVLATPCNVPCGTSGTECKQGELCVRRSTGIGFTYSCQKNPCTPPSPVSCECAAPLCGDRPYVCSSADEQQVNCDCLVCV